MNRVKPSSGRCNALWLGLLLTPGLLAAQSPPSPLAAAPAIGDGPAAVVVAGPVIGDGPAAVVVAAPVIGDGPAAVVAAAPIIRSSPTVVVAAAPASGNGPAALPAVSGNSAATVASPPNPNCLTSAGAWQSSAMPTQSDAFTAQFDATPGAAQLDGLIGLSNGAAIDESGLAVSVRFNSAGTIEAGSGTGYAAAVSIPYNAATSYHFRLAVDLPSHTYSVYVTSPSSAEQTLGANLTFRADQSGVRSLDHLGLVAFGGSASACNLNAAAAPPPPGVSITVPAAGTVVTGSVIVSARASSNIGVAGVQFKLDGADLASEVTASPYSIAWNTALAADGPHMLTAVVRDTVGNSSTSISVPVVVADAPPVLSAISAASVTANGAAIVWATDRVSDSQVVYGLNRAYGQATVLDPGLVTSHSEVLSGLSACTVYHYVVRSRDAGGVLSVSGDQTFATLMSDGVTPCNVVAAAEGPAVAPLASDDTQVKAPQRFLSPAQADGINDEAVFGTAASAVTVFDLRGRRVFHASQSASGSAIVWNCRDGSGRIVPSGVYIAEITTSDSRRLYQSFAVVK